MKMPNGWEPARLRADDRVSCPACRSLVGVEIAGNEAKPEGGHAMLFRRPSTPNGRTRGQACLLLKAPQ